ncbi:MAG: PAS domain S-box protein [Syntrophorhabdales bacterium]
MGKKDSNAFLREDERKCLEEVLNASQSQLAEAMDLAHIVYWEFDTTTDTYVFNDSFYAFYGTSAEREGGYRMPTDEYAERFVHPDDRPLYHEHGRQILSGKGPAFLTDLEHRIVRRDGAVRFILVRGRGFRDATGRIVRLYGANQDISERKEAAAALLESEERCRKIFEESSLGMVMAGPDYHFMRANAAFCRMLGYAEPELISFTFEDITHPDHIAEDAMHVDALYRDKISFYRTEKRYVRKDKQIVWASTTVNTVRDKSGEFLYFLAMVEDISERKRAEEEREALESQLRHAQKMEAIGQLAGGIAHDFNNILTVIIGFGTLVRMALDKHQPVSREYVDQMLTSSEKAANLTESLLTFSRKRQVNLEPCKVNDLVSTAGKLLTRLLTEDIELRITTSPENSIIMVDVTQMDQILMNLAANARDAMPKGGLLSIETEEVVLDDEFRKTHGYGKPGRYALFSVSDTGTGMDEATKEHIFEPFFTTKGVGKGTGLGLSTVYGTVKGHNGYITVYSEPHHGTTFRIYLPLVETIEQGKSQPSANLRGGTETVLVVEDEPGVRKFTTKILQAYGYTTIEARDGENAINVFMKSKDKIDLIIMDVVMSRKNGKEAYEEIRRSSQDVKIIFVSGVCQFLVEASVAPIGLSFLYAATDTASPSTRSMVPTTPAI